MGRPVGGADHSLSSSEESDIDEDHLRQIEAWYSRMTDGTYSLGEISREQIMINLGWLVGYARRMVDREPSEVKIMRHDMKQIRKERDDMIRRIIRYERMRLRDAMRHPIGGES